MKHLRVRTLTALVLATGSACNDDEVERCREAAEALVASCPEDPSPPRRCVVAELSTYCRDEAWPALYAEALDCLTAASRGDLCISFANSEAPQTCLMSVYADLEDPRVDAVVAAYARACGFALDPSLAAPPLFALTAAELTEIRECIEQAGRCADVAAGCFDVQAPLNACFM